MPSGHWCPKVCVKVATRVHVWFVSLWNDWMSGFMWSWNRVSFCFSPVRTVSSFFLKNTFGRGKKSVWFNWQGKRRITLLSSNVATRPLAVASPTEKRFEPSPGTHRTSVSVLEVFTSFTSTKTSMLPIPRASNSESPMPERSEKKLERKKNYLWFIGLKVEKKHFWSLMCLEAPESTMRNGMKWVRFWYQVWREITRHLMSLVGFPFLCLFLCFLCKTNSGGSRVSWSKLFLGGVCRILT